MGKNFAADMAVRCDVKEALRALIPILSKKGGEALSNRARISTENLEKSNW